MQQHLSPSFCPPLSPPNSYTSLQSFKFNANTTAIALVVVLIASYQSQVSAVNQYNSIIKLHCILELILIWCWGLLVNDDGGKNLLLFLLLGANTNIFDIISIFFLLHVMADVPTMSSCDVSMAASFFMAKII